MKTIGKIAIVAMALIASYYAFNWYIHAIANLPYIVADTIVTTFAVTTVLLGLVAWVFSIGGNR